MIPYFQVNYFLVGPLTIQVWGLFVAIGVIIGVIVGTKLVNKYLLSDDIYLDLVVWALFSGLIFARIFHILFYNPEFYVANPGEIIKFWKGGASSLGGFFGGSLALYLIYRIRKFKLVDFLPYLDVLSITLWLGMAIGRLGCFVIHDHPGILSNFILAVRFPVGSRLDLGFIESILVFGIFGYFYINFKKFVTKKWGLVAVYSLYTYAVSRFFLDFLRARDLDFSDQRYFAFTPAQWGMITVIVALTFIIFSGKISQSLKKN